MTSERWSSRFIVQNQGELHRLGDETENADTEYIRSISMRRFFDLIIKSALGDEVVIDAIVQSAPTLESEQVR